MAKSGTVENFAIGYQDYLQAPLQVRGYLHFCSWTTGLITVLTMFLAPGG